MTTQEHETPDLYQLIDGLNTEQRQAVTTTEGPVLILAGPGSGKCVHPLTRLVINDELMLAEEVWQRFQTNETFDGEGWVALPNTVLHIDSFDETTGKFTQENISALYRQRVAERMRVITFRDGSRITATLAHKFYDGEQWTNQIEVGDVLALPQKLSHREQPLDVELAELLGWLVGEGYERIEAKSTKAFHLVLKDKMRLVRLRDLIRNIAQRYDLAAGKMEIKPCTGRSTYKLGLWSASFHRFLTKEGYNFGQRAAHKQVPPCVMQADQAGIVAFLRAMFDAEGWVEPQRIQVGITTASPRLAEELRHLLRRCGVWGRISKSEKYATNGTQIRRPYWTLYIGGPSLRVFAASIGFSDLVKAEALATCVTRECNPNRDLLPSPHILNKLVKDTHLAPKRIVAGRGDAGRYLLSKRLSRKTYQSAIRPNLLALSMREGETLAGNQFHPAQVLTANDTQHIQSAIARLDKLEQAELVFEQVASVEEIDYEGWVYDFTVERTHNFVAEGVLCHNTRVITFRIAYLIDHERVHPWNILAVTFTNKAAREMRERLEALVGAPAKELHVGTFHSICARVLRGEMENMDAGRTRSFTILDDDEQQTLIKTALRDLNLDDKRFQPRTMHSHISRAKNELLTAPEFAASVNKYFDEVVARVYVRYDELLRAQNAVDFDDLILLTHRVWQTDPDALRRAQNRYHYLHVDEFQDCNRAQYELVRLLALGLPEIPTHPAIQGRRNLCVVGDEDQCLIAGTQIMMADGSQRLIETIAAGDQVLSNYGSGDLRPALVERVARRDGVETGICITTQEGHTLTSTAEHTHFAGYRLGVTPQTYFTYLMYRRGIGFRLGTSQVYTRGQTVPVVGFTQRARQEHADAVWIVSTHENENEARINEYILSLRYQIPTLPFVPRKGTSVNGIVHDEQYIRRIFAAFDTEAHAEHLLQDLGLSIEHPHFRPRSKNSIRHHIVVTLCGDRRGASPMHRISIVGNSSEARESIEDLGLSVRQAKEGSESWRHETVHSSMANVLATAERIRSVVDAELVFAARLGKQSSDITESNSLPFTRAASVKPGMVMFTADGGYDVVTQVEIVPLTAPVYDLDIARTHNFIANDIVTHNSIYAWRGASSKNILGFERDFPDRNLIILARNYRSTQTILDAAMSVVRQNPDRVDKELWTDKGSGPRIEIREVYNEEEEGKFIADTVRILQARGEAKLSDCAVLYRTNAQSRAIEEQLLRASVPYKVIGSRKFYERKEIRDVVAYLRLIANPRDTLSLTRIINVPSRKIGEATVRQLLAWAEERHQIPEEAIGAIDEHPTLATAPKEALKRFATLMADLRATIATVPLDQAIDKVLEKTGYASEIRDGTDEGEERWRNVLELRRVASDYSEIAPESALALFLENVALIGGADTASTSAEGGHLAEEQRDAVTLITLHAAKGLEFPIIFMVGMEEGVLPHSRSMENREQLEEERRLAYVGITRAMKQLYLVRAFRRSFYGGSSVIQEPSRFLGDIPAKLITVETKDGQSSGKSASRTPSRPLGGSLPPRSTFPMSRTATRPTSGEPAPFVPRAQRHGGALPPLPEPDAPEPPAAEAAPPSDAVPPALRIPVPGDKVRHRIFGRGIVLKVIATADSTEVEVLFDRTEVGKKTLDLNFAKLDILT